MARGIFRERKRSSALADIREQVTREVARIHGLPDHFMARALRDLSRQARAELGMPYEDPEHAGYGTATLWTVLTGLSLHLGEKRLTLQERRGADRLPVAREDMRHFVGLCLMNTEIPSTTAIREDAIACRIISKEFANGNPITSALDRVAPPQPEYRDWVTRHMREISRHRFGHGDWLAWTPAFNDYPRRSSALFEQLFDELDPDHGEEGHAPSM